jgi:polyferredoxin
MQLVEYVVWTYGVDPPKYIGAGGQGEGDLEASAARRAASPYVNHYASLAAASLLALQPIASILTVSQSYIPIAAYLLFAFIAHLVDNDARSLKERYRMTSEPHLVWHWLTPTPTFSLLVYFLFLLTPLILSQQFVLLAAVLAALAFSILSYSRAWGSVWCYAIHCIVVVLCVR